MKLNDIIINNKKIGERHDNFIIKELPDGGYIKKQNNGNIYYFNKKDQRHREDGPAVIFASGSKEWYKNGKRHRDDGPAIVRDDGTQAWCKNGHLGRTDGPTIIYADGSEHWYKNDKLHRDDGPAIITASGRTEWYNNGDRIEPPRGYNEA